MRKNLLEMVQTILAALDSDEVNSINDTIESTQIVSILESVFYDMITADTMPEHGTAFQLNASLDIAKPCLMTVPSNVTNVKDVRYDYKKAGEVNSNYTLIKYQPFDEFLLFQQALRNDATGVGSMVIQYNQENYSFVYRNNFMPSFYTVIDDNTLMFDAYDSTLDSTLQKSKTLCTGTVFPPFTKTNTFVPNLDITQFSLLINKAKVRAFNELKQQANAEAAGESRLQKIVVQKRKRKTPNTPEVQRVARFGRR